MAWCSRLLRDARWEKIRLLLPKRPPRTRGGRTPTRERKVLEGTSWIMSSVTRRQGLSKGFPSPSTCWRRLQDWEEQGGWLKIWCGCLGEHSECQQINWRESSLGGSFAPSKKKGFAVSETKRGTGGSGGWWLAARVFLWETTFTLPPPSEVKVVGVTRATIRVERRHRAGRPLQKPLRLIAGCGYGGDPLRKQMEARGIKLIAPNRKNRLNPRPRMGRSLRRYKRR